MVPVEVVKLAPLMRRTSGNPDIRIGLIDGPIAFHHPDLARASLREVFGGPSGACSRVDSAACVHGTFVAGILCAKRESVAPAICPACTVLIRPIFSEPPPGLALMPSTTPQELATAMLECIEAEARVINLSLAFAYPSMKGENALAEALDHAMRRRVLVVAAAGNQGALGSTVLTCHPWVIPVVACDQRGRPLNESNLSGSIGRRGVSAPGAGITSLGARGPVLTLDGTSVAAPFVTGAIALLWSEFPTATAVQIRRAVISAFPPHRPTVAPPVLDVEAAYRLLHET